MKALNRNGKVIFNNGKVAFIVTIETDKVALANKLLTECKVYAKKILNECKTREMQLYITKLLNELDYYENEYSLKDINIIRLEAIKEYFIKVLNY